MKTPQNYIPHTGEKYMSLRQQKYFHEVFRKMLFSISASSEKTIDSLKDEISVIPDENDRASKEAEFTLELRERERESRLEQKINYVLKK